MIEGINMGWIVAMIAVLIFAAGIRIVRPVEKGLVETLGKYSRTAEQGFNWIIPIVQRMQKINITENMVDIPSQQIITKDDLNAVVDAVVYFKVEDVHKAGYNADDYYVQIVSLAQTTLRAVIGELTLSEANQKRNKINDKLRTELQREADDWGMKIVKTELQKIDPPQDVQDAMNDVVVAERKKIAAKDLASAVEIKADGERRAEIKRAEGQARAIKEVANARAEEIKVVNQSAQTHFKGNAQTLKALEVTQNSLQHGSKYVIDSRSNLVNVMSEASGLTPLPESKGQDSPGFSFNMTEKYEPKTKRIEDELEDIEQEAEKFD